VIASWIKMLCGSWNCIGISWSLTLGRAQIVYNLKRMTSSTRSFECRNASKEWFVRFGKTGRSLSTYFS
jgi:hypothetical protein